MVKAIKRRLAALELRVVKALGMLTLFAGSGGTFAGLDGQKYQAADLHSLAEKHNLLIVRFVKEQRP